jgi:hypothetical protein
MTQKLLALYGLKFNPFTPDLPTDAIYVPPRIEDFCWRIEQVQVREGGFAIIHGDPGSGKSIALRVLAERLARLPDITVGAINHPQSNLADFYRELGDVFGVPLRPHNRWGGCQGAARTVASASRIDAAPPGAADRRGAGDGAAGAVRTAPDGQRPLRFAAAAMRGAGR